MLTLSDLKAEVKHALDGSDPSQEFTALGQINAAGTMFYDLHSWKFKARQKATLSTVSGSSRADLPSDFSEEISIKRNTAGIQMTSLAEVARQDAGNISRAASTGFYLGSIVYPTPEPGQPGVLPLPFLTIVPQPSGDNATAFDLWYKSRWPTLIENTDIVPVPPYCEGAIREFCALYAKGKRDDRFLEYIEVFSRSQVFDHAKRADGRQQSEYGETTGGAVSLLESGPRNFLATERADAPA